MFLLAFQVGQLFTNGTILHLEYIDISDIPRFSCHIYPIVSPAHNAPEAMTKNFLDEHRASSSIIIMLSGY